MEMSGQKETIVPQIPRGAGLGLLRLSLTLTLFPNLFPSQMSLIFLLGSILLPLSTPFLYSPCWNPSPMS